MKRLGARPKTATNQAGIPGQGEGLPFASAGMIVKLEPVANGAGQGDDLPLESAGITVKEEPVTNEAPPRYIVHEPRPNWRSKTWRPLQLRAFLSSSDDDAEAEEVDGQERHHTGEGSTPQDFAQDGPRSSPVDTLAAGQGPGGGSLPLGSPAAGATIPVAVGAFGSGEDDVVDRATQPSGAGGAGEHLINRARPSCVLGSTPPPGETDAAPDTAVEIDSPPTRGEFSSNICSVRAAQRWRLQVRTLDGWRSS